MSNPFTFRYGSYQHEANEVSPKVLNQDRVWDAAGNFLGENIHWELEGRLHAADATALTAALEALERAYSVQGQDAGFYDGDTPTAHMLRSSTFLGGVRVVSFQFVEGPGEYTTYRSYRLVLEATTDPGTGGGGGSPEATYSEGFTFTGGGPVYVWVQSRNAPPQLQLVTMMSTYGAVQEGYLSSNMAQPPYAPPRWPSICHGERTRVTWDQPKALGKQGRYKTSWHYEFESDTPFI